MKNFLLRLLFAVCVILVFVFLIPVITTLVGIIPIVGGVLAMVIGKILLAIVTIWALWFVFMNGNWPSWPNMP